MGLFVEGCFGFLLFAHGAELGEHVGVPLGPRVVAARTLGAVVIGGSLVVGGGHGFAADAAWVKK